MRDHYFHHVVRHTVNVTTIWVIEISYYLKNVVQGYIYPPKSMCRFCNLTFSNKMLDLIDGIQRLDFISETDLIKQWLKDSGLMLTLIFSTLGILLL